MAAEKQNTEQLRAQAALLLSHARAQSIDIQRALAGASGNDSLHARLAAAAAQISGAISGLSQALGSSSFTLRAADLMAFESIVNSSDTSSLVSEANAQAAKSANSRNLAAASAAVRQEVQDLSCDIFDKRIFDPYLHFSSAEDEAEYRKRQADAQKYINDQLVRQTPQGDLNAAEAMQRAYLDAGTHGADRSPDYAPRLNGLTANIGRLKAAMPDHGRANSDRAAASDASAHSAPPTRVGATSGAGTRNASAGIDFAAMDAKLEAAGLQAPPATETTGHGVSIQKPAGKTALTITG